MILPQHYNLIPFQSYNPMPLPKQRLYAGLRLREWLVRGDGMQVIGQLYKYCQPLQLNIQREASGFLEVVLPDRSGCLQVELSLPKASRTESAMASTVLRYERAARREESRILSCQNLFGG